MTKLTMGLFTALSLCATTGAARAADEIVPRPKDEAKSTDATSSGSGTVEHRKMDLRVTPEGAPAPRTAYVHEGFYFRAAVGPGLFHSSITDRRADSSGGTAAFGVAVDAMVGGSPAPGLALGVGGLAHIGMGGQIDGTKTGGIFHANVGPFFDAFPNRKGGFHLGALVGGSTLAISSDVSPKSPLWGGGGAAWVGWDAWVAPDWSTGVQLQTGGSYVTGPGVGMSVFHLNLMITLLNH